MNCSHQRKTKGDYVLINLIVLKISKGIHISKHHAVYLKYIQLILTIYLNKTGKKKEARLVITLGSHPSEIILG